MERTVIKGDYQHDVGQMSVRRARALLFSVITGLFAKFDGDLFRLLKLNPSGYCNFYKLILSN